MTRMKSHVAIVTGGGDGIGRGIARRFGAEGARLVIADVDAAAGQAVADDISEDFGTEALNIPTDVGDKGQVIEMVKRALDEWGRIDTLVNNAWPGVAVKRVETKSDEELARSLTVGFYGAFWSMQAVFPTMRARGRGRIINMCSINGINAHAGTADYNCAKEALRTLTRTTAREWARYGITANIICPSARTAAFLEMMRTHPELAEPAEAANPMGRMGDPETDIAPVAAFLASDDAGYVTGNTMFVDGGFHINGLSWASPDLPDS